MGADARRRHRQRLRRPRRRHSPAGRRLRHGPVRGARPARRPRLRLSRRRLHLRRRPDRDHRAATASRSCSALRPAQRWPTTSSCMPVAPVLPPVWADGDSFDYVGDSATHGARRSARRNAGRRRRLRALRATTAGGCSRRRLRASWPRTPFLALLGHGARRAAARAAARRSARCIATVAQFVRDERVRQALIVPLAAGRRQPVRDQLDLHADPLPRAARGASSFRAAAPARWSPALVRLFERARRRAAPAHAGRAGRASRGGGRSVHTSCTRAAPRPRRSIWSCRTPTSHHTYATLYGDEPARGRRMRRRLERMRLVDVAVRPLLRDRPPLSRPRPPHRRVRAALRGLLRDIFHGATLPDDFSLYLHAPTVTDPSLAPPGCEALLRAVARAAPGQRAARLGRGRAGRTPSASWPRSSGSCPTCAATS